MVQLLDQVWLWLLGPLSLAAHFSCKCGDGQGHDRCDLYYKRPHRRASSHYSQYSSPGFLYVGGHLLIESCPSTRLEPGLQRCTAPYSIPLQRIWMMMMGVLTFSQLIISLPSGYCM